MMNTAILLSGGVGSRLRSDVPKQYIRIGDRMLITYTLTALTKVPLIDRILIVAKQEWHECIMADIMENGGFSEKIMGFAIPGFNRQMSIINGMQEILRQTAPGILRTVVPEGLNKGADCEQSCEEVSTADEDTVFIHDAVRPMLSGKQVEDCFDALAGHDGVMPVLPMKDTVYISRNGETVSGLLDRNEIFMGQAPELFRFKKYYQANMALTPEQLAAINGSTEPAILAGLDIVMIAGDENNFKITTPQDLERLQNLGIFDQIEKVE